MEVNELVLIKVFF